MATSQAFRHGRQDPLRAEAIDHFPQTLAHRFAALRIAAQVGNRLRHLPRRKPAADIQRQARPAFYQEPHGRQLVFVRQDRDAGHSAIGQFPDCAARRDHSQIAPGHPMGNVGRIAAQTDVAASAKSRSAAPPSGNCPVQREPPPPGLRGELSQFRKGHFGRLAGIRPAERQQHRAPPLPGFASAAWGSGETRGGEACTRFQAAAAPAFHGNGTSARRRLGPGSR